MSKNKDNFRRFLIKEGVDFEEIPLDNGGHGFSLVQTIENGPRLMLGVFFTSEDDNVDFRIFNIAKIENPLKKEFLYSLLNELNISYRFVKFIESDNEVIASYAMFLYGSDDYTKDIFETLVMMYDCVKETFPKFMKLQWA